MTQLSAEKDYVDYPVEKAYDGTYFFALEKGLNAKTYDLIKALNMEGFIGYVFNLSGIESVYSTPICYVGPEGFVRLQYAVASTVLYEKYARRPIAVRFSAIKTKNENRDEVKAICATCGKGIDLPEEYDTDIAWYFCCKACKEEYANSEYKVVSREWIGEDLFIHVKRETK